MRFVGVETIQRSTSWPSIEMHGCWCGTGDQCGVDSAVSTSLASDAAIQGMRLVSRRTGEYVGPCPYCRAGEDRFHVWTLANGKRPAGRYWCRTCDAKGVLDQQREHARSPQMPEPAHAAPKAQIAHIPHYRQLYELVMLWAQRWLFEPANPEPLAYIRSRGLTDADARALLLGYSLNDPQSLVQFVQEHAPELLPFAQEAGILTLDRSGLLRTHWNLCGALIFPTIAHGEIVDLRMRRIGAGQRGRSLAGSPIERGAIFPVGWDAIGNADTVILTESGEFKTLVPLTAYRHGQLEFPTIGFPGMNGFQSSLGPALLQRGVITVIMAYDSQPRPTNNDVLVLAPEERWTLIYGAQLRDAGLHVRVLRLSLFPGETKTDLDSFLLTHGPTRLQRELDDAVPLAEYYRSLPRSLLDDRLPALVSYPTRRPRPRPIAPSAPVIAELPMALDQARSGIRQLVAEHVSNGQGILVLAHPPGVGKGHNTTVGLIDYVKQHPEPGFMVWTATRKNQLHDQTGIDFIPLHGRNPSNCHRFAEAQALSAKGYRVKDALCATRCPFVGNCLYLRQFSTAGDYFAPQPLLQATGWWRDAGVLVLDEFDPARLTRIVDLSSADLAAMYRATDDPHAIAILRWTNQVIASTSDRSISGTLFYRELEVIAAAEGLTFSATLAQAVANRPDPQSQAILPGAPQRMSLLDFQALPPNYLDLLLELYAREGRRRLSGQHFTSRVEATNGRLILALRQEHLIAQLANSAQPKIILDATAQPALLNAILPGQPICIEQPAIAGAGTIIQVIGQDWAKTTLRNQRQERGYQEIIRYIRPERRTLIVATMDCADELRIALAQRGIDPQLVAVEHYGGLRGSNAYRGWDVILAQVYHPNLDALIREGRALFADDMLPLDERIITVERPLTDASGASWQVTIPTFADSRLAALLEARREAEMAQCALRGRPLDHPEVQITIVSNLPLPGLAPTVIQHAFATPQSNGQRQEQTIDRLCAAAQHLLDAGKHLLDATMIAAQANASITTVRTHWLRIAHRLDLEPIINRRRRSMPTGGEREYAHAALVRRQIGILATKASPALPIPEATATAAIAPATIDQACNMTCITGLIYRRAQAGPVRVLHQRTRRVWRPTQLIRGPP